MDDDERVHGEGIGIGQAGKSGGEARTRVALRRLTRLFEERTRRIAQELHDESSSLLATVHLAVDNLAREIPPEHHERLVSIRRMLDEVQEQLREISHELRPALLDDFGLMSSIEYLCGGVATRTGLSIAIDGAIEERFPRDVETAVYRTVQEGLANVVKHSNATHVVVRLRRGPGHVICSIRDDGKGLAAPDGGVRRGPGIGLLGLRARLAAIRGRLFIESQPGEGTRLTVVAPTGGSHVA